MFNKLKREFVIINMSLLTAVFVVIFSVIFILTAVSGERQTDFALRSIMFSPPHPAGPPKPAMASSIVVQLDNEGQIVYTNTLVYFGEEIIEKSVATALEINKVSAHIDIGENNYAFLKHTSDYGTKIVFVDRTPQQKALNNLLITFVVAGMISLGLLYLISVYFANRTIAPIKEMFEKQKQFITDASHELRTPLTVIKTNASLIMCNSHQSVASQLKWLEYILLQVDRMSDLVDDMLSLSRYDYLESAAVFSDYNLSKILTGTLLSFEAILYENNINLDSQIEPDIVLNGNIESIKRLITILIDNAAKHTPAGGTIAIELGSEKNIIKLAVSNTGVSIPKEHIEKIFERFYRVDTSRSKESGGYGLGLAIAKSIAEQNQGRIYATSREGIDTTFIVELPK